jgi:hypothetical protein
LPLEWPRSDPEGTPVRVDQQRREPREDVKEYYFYLDSTPTHSYIKYLYKYPQAAFPYESLVENNRRRSRQELEYELLDTGVFEEDRYFDVLVEYGKTTPEDTLIQISVTNPSLQMTGAASDARLEAAFAFSPLS